MELIQTPDKQFTDGTRRVPGTPVPAWWLNQLQGELVNLIKAAGIDPDKSDHTQVAAAVKLLSESASQVADIAALRRYSGNGYVNVNAYHAGTAVGGGMFVADKADKSTPDNGGTVIVSDDGTRWKRVFSGGLSLHDFGFDKSRNNAQAALNAAEAAALGVVVDCLGLSIDTGSHYPQKNKYTNGKFIINGVAADVQYQPVRNGIGRFIAGVGAAENLQSSEWTGSDVTAVGKGAMGKMKKCVSGIAIGNRAQGNSLISRDNIALGADSLINVQAETEWYSQEYFAGTRNVGIGGNAGRGITTGYNNVAIGRNGGQGLSTGKGTVAIGAGACAGTAPVGFSGDIENIFDVPTSESVAIGMAALANYQKNAAVAVGAQASRNLKTAERSVSIGYGAAEMLDSDLAPNGGSVVWTGTESGSYTQSGPRIDITVPNIHGAVVGGFIGVRLLDGEAKTLMNDVVPAKVVSIHANVIAIDSSVSLNTTGRAELKFVYSAQSGRDAGTGVTAVGYKAVAAAKNASHIVAVGADALRFGEGHFKSVAIGDSALRENRHEGTVAVGYWAAPRISSKNCVFIGDSAGWRNQAGEIASGHFENAIAIGAGARVAGNNEIQIGNGGQVLYAPTGVNVRSDLRDKADIQPLAVGLDFVKKLKPITGVYDRRDSYVDELFTDLPETERAAKLREWWSNPVKDGSKKETKRHFWFGAQDVRDLQAEFGALPMLQHQNQNGADTYSLAYGEFVPVLVKAVQELSAQVDEMKKQLEGK